MLTGANCTCELTSNTGCFWPHVPLHVASAPSLAVFRQRLETFFFPFLPRHYHMTRALLSTAITTVWTTVVLAIINIIQATLKMFVLMMMIWATSTVV